MHSRPGDENGPETEELASRLADLERELYGPDDDAGTVPDPAVTESAPPALELAPQARREAPEAAPAPLLSEVEALPEPGADEPRTERAELAPFAESPAPLAEAPPPGDEPAAGAQPDHAAVTELWASAAALEITLDDLADQAVELRERAAAAYDEQARAQGEAPGQWADQPGSDYYEMDEQGYPVADGVAEYDEEYAEYDDGTYGEQLEQPYDESYADPYAVEYVDPYADPDPERYADGVPQPRPKAAPDWVRRGARGQETLARQIALIVAIALATGIVTYLIVAVLR
jgi:hypothetical protein